MSDSAREEAALARLGLWCIRYSPLVTPSPPDGIYIDVSGSADLFKGETALLQDLLERLSETGLSARAAIADTPGCACGRTVRQKQDRCPGRASDALWPLPVAALRLTPPVPLEAAHVRLKFTEPVGDPEDPAQITANLCEADAQSRFSSREAAPAGAIKCYLLCVGARKPAFFMISK